jgi:competence CoiA-like predicted nuclease
MGSKSKRDDGVCRKITHPVRFAEDEYEQLKQKAYNARVSLTEFIRRAALRRQVVEPPPPPQINWKLYEKLNAIGVNLNQIAKAVNRAVKSGQGANVDVERLQNLVVRLNETIRETQMQLLECGVTDEEEEEQL